MKKLLVITALAASALTSHADHRRIEYAGYRVGASAVANDQTRVSGLPYSVYDSELPAMTSVELSAGKATGQKIARWWTYENSSNVPPTQVVVNGVVVIVPGYIQYNNAKTIAEADYSTVVTYGTVDYSPAYVVVDYDWIKYRLSYERNGGSGTPPGAVNDIIYTNTLTIAGNTLSRRGYTWTGWTNDLTSTVWFGGEAVTGESLGLKSIEDGSNVVLRAGWTPNTYTVTLDADGGIVSPSSVEVTYDAPWPSLRTPVKEGYYFDGWYNDRACTIATPTDSTVSITNDTTIYAKWTRKLVATFVDPVDSRREEVDVRYGEKPVPPFTPYHKNYTFREWLPAVGAIVHDTVFTAQFAGAQYFITYHANFGSPEKTEQIDYVYGTAKAAPNGASLFPRTGYAFAGWAADAVSGVVRFRADDDINAFLGDGDALYAVWAPVECAIHFDANGGTGEMSDAAARYDEVYTIPDCAFAKPGVEFLGWATNATGVVVFMPGDSIANVTAAPGGAFTLYAVWAETRYIAFDGNGANDPSAMSGEAMALELGETKALAPNKFEKTGYTFAGWATNYVAATNHVWTYADRAPVACADLWTGIGETNVLHAVWQANTYTVVFNPNGAGGELKYQSFVYDQPQCLNNSVSDDNFKGWATNSTGKVVYGRGDVSNLTAEANGTFTLYAVWDTGDLSKAMDCNDLHWNQTGNGTKWNIAQEGYDTSETSISNMVYYWDAANAKMRSNTLSPKEGASGRGRLSFYYKIAEEEGGKLYFIPSTNADDVVSLPTSTNWVCSQEFLVEDISAVQIYFNLISDAYESATVWIDQMRWEPMDVISLKSEGWNKVKFNSLPKDSSPSNVFAEVRDGIDCVVQGGMTWSPKTGGRLAKLAAGIQYWVHTTSNVSWTVEGGSVPDVEDDAYGPFGRFADIDMDARELHPTVYGDVSLTFGGRAAAVGDCIAAYRKSDGKLCGLGRAYGSGSGVKCDLVLYAEKGAEIHFRAWRSGTPYTAMLDVDGSCDTAAPAPGAIAAEKMTLTVAAREFTVSFDGNGGTGVMADQKFTEGERQRLAANAFRREGYLFAGWKDYGGREYKDGESIPVESDLTLVAQWALVDVSCSPTSANFPWRATGGGALAGRFGVECNTNWTAAVAESAESWITVTSAASGSVEYRLSENYAKEARAGAIVVTAEGAGRTTMFAVSQEGRAAEPILDIQGGVLAGVAMEGYTTCEIPGTVTSIAAGAFKDNTEVYAIAIPASVVNIGDGAFAGCANLTNVVFAGDAPSAGKGIFRGTPEGLVVSAPRGLTGWPEDGAKWPSGDDADARRVELSRYFTVSFDWNGWDGGSRTNITVDAGGSCSLPFLDELFLPDAEAHGRNREGARAGYVFGGWNATGSAGDDMESFAEFVPASNVTLKARWVPNTYVFRFDANGGQPENRRDFRQTTGAEWNVDGLVEPSMAGAGFAGWWTDATGGEKVVVEGVFSITGSLASATTLYARWIKPRTITVNYGSAGRADEAMSSVVSAVPGTRLVLEAVDRSGEDMAFSRWTYTPAAADLGELFDQGAARTECTMPDADVTLTANYAGRPGYAVVGAQVELEQAGASGTATMNPKNGLVAVGKSVTLTAKAGKDSVFAYWLVGEEKVGYTTTLKYAPEGDSVVTAVFRLKSAVAAPEFDEGGAEQSAAVVGVAYGGFVPVADAAYPAKFTAKRLPSGLKIDAASGRIAGVPTKAGAYDVEISAKGGADGKATSSCILHMDVAELPLWAQGAFVGSVKCKTESVKLEDEFGLATMTVAAKGKIGGKISLAGTNWTFSAASFSRVEQGVGVATNFAVEAVAKAGKATRDLVLEVGGGALGDRALPNGVVEGSFGDGEVVMWRNVWKDKSTAAAAKAVLSEFEGVYTVSIADGADYGSGYLSLTVGKNGDVKATGKLADGTGVSATSPLMYDEEAGWFAMLYTAPSAYKGGAFAAAVGFGELLQPVMFAPQWSSRNPQATGEYGGGFGREVDLAGAYYDKLEKLSAYYESLRLDIGGAPELGYTYKETSLDKQGRKVTTSSASTAQAVDTLGQDGMTIAVNDDGRLVVAKATKPVQNKETREWSYNGPNDGGLTLSFTQATGIFKGSYTFWYDYVSANDKTTGKETLSHTSKKVGFEGIIVQGEEPGGFYLWDAAGEYKDPKTGKTKTYKYKQSYAVTIEQQAQQQ